MPNDDHPNHRVLVLTTTLALVVVTLLLWSQDVVGDDEATAGVSLILGLSWAWLIWQRHSGR
jgi:hypothetical protein